MRKGRRQLEPAANRCPLGGQWPVPCSLGGFSPAEGSTPSCVAYWSGKHHVWEMIYCSPKELFACWVSFILGVSRKIAVIQFTPLRTIFHPNHQCLVCNWSCCLHCWWSIHCKCMQLCCSRTAVHVTKIQPRKYFLHLSHVTQFLPSSMLPRL